MVEGCGLRVIKITLNDLGLMLNPGYSALLRGGDVRWWISC